MSQIGRPNSFRQSNDSGAQNRSETACFIVNPRAGAGKAGRKINILRKEVDRAFAQAEVCTTEGPGHASILAQQAIENKFDIVAAVGGDGTCHEVINGMFDGKTARSNHAIFAAIPFGTGSDLIKTLEMPKSLPEALWIAGTGITLPSDVGWVSLTHPSDDTPKEEIFVNVAGFGANGDVVRRANAMSKTLGGRLTFLQASLQSAVAYQPSQIRIQWDDGEWQGTMMSCFIANGAYCGGGMWVGKGGSMQDGKFDVTILPPNRLSKTLVDARRLYDGSIQKMAGAIRFQTTRLVATPLPDEPVFVDLDGEMPGRIPATFEVLHRAIQIRGGWRSNPLFSDQG